MAGFNPFPCMPLKTGAYIVAVLEVLNYSVSVVLGILGLAITAGVRKQIDMELNARPIPTRDEEHQLLGLNIAFIIFLVSVVLNLFGLVFSILLSVGVYKGSRKMMVSWMTMECINLLMKILVALFPLKSPSPVSQIVKIGLSIYFLLIVYAHYNELRMEEPPNYFPAAGQMEMGQNPNLNPNQSQSHGQGQRYYEQNQFQDEDEFTNISEPAPSYYHTFQEKPNTNLPAH